MWLHSSVGRASHRYRGGHGFESRWSRDFFRLLVSNCLNWRIYCDDYFSLSVSYFVFLHSHTPYMIVIPLSEDARRCSLLIFFWALNTTWIAKYHTHCMLKHWVRWTHWSMLLMTEENTYMYQTMCHNNTYGLMKNKLPKYNSSWHRCPETA